jgi:hypothetical protein
MASSGILQRVDLVTEVSEERITIIMVKRVGELGTTLAVTLMMEAILSSETLVFTRARRLNIPEGGIYHHISALQ